MGETASRISTATRIVRRPAGGTAQHVTADICVLGAGIAGVSAALEAARLGRTVALVDGLPALGGQAVNSIIGTFCGLFANGTHGHQLTRGIADDILRELGAQDALHYRRGGPSNTTVVMYDEIALSRWIEEAVRKSGIIVLTGAILRGVTRDGGRVRALDLASRYGDVKLSATGFVDASGDAVLTYEAGFACREPADGPLYGTQMMVLEGIDEAAQPSREELTARAREKAAQYGLVRTTGFAFVFPGRGTALVNMTHIETPLEPVAAAQTALIGKTQADTVLHFLRREYPKGFGNARVRSYGLPGIRQTRWIKGRAQLTLDEVRAGTRFPDAVARTAWPIELHDRPDGYVWEPFPDDHMHYVPFGCSRAGGGRQRRRGRALHRRRQRRALQRAGDGTVHRDGRGGGARARPRRLGSVAQIDMAALKRRVWDNVERTD